MPYQNQRSSRLCCRIHHLEKKVIELAARKAGLSISDYIRRAAMALPTKNPHAQKETELYSLLLEYREGFAHIMAIAQQNKELDIVTPDLQGLIKQIKTLIEKLPS